MRCFLPLLAFCTLAFLSPDLAQADQKSATLDGSTVVREMNLARQHPEVYIQLLEAQREHYRGNIFVSPRGALVRTREGLAGVNEAIRFLHRVRPVGALNLSTGIARAAADHVADQANGTLGHDGSDRSNPGVRMNRHGSWSVRWGENIAYGKSTAREIVLALIIDDGLRSRKHRENIFNPAFNYAGAAVGAHARYRTVCSIDFAGGYAEQREAPKPLFAGN